MTYQDLMDIIRKHYLDARLNRDYLELNWKAGAATYHQYREAACRLNGLSDLLTDIMIKEDKSNKND